jgi:hypothetical protein
VELIRSLKQECECESGCAVSTYVSLYNPLEGVISQKLGPVVQIWGALYVVGSSENWYIYTLTWDPGLVGLKVLAILVLQASWVPSRKAAHRL